MNTEICSMRVMNGKEKHALRYYLYVIVENVDLKNAVTSMYGHSMQGNLQEKREALLHDVNAFSLYDVEEVTNDNMSRNTVATDVVGRGYNNDAMDLGPDYLIAAPNE